MHNLFTFSMCIFFFFLVFARYGLKCAAYYDYCLGPTIFDTYEQFVSSLSVRVFFYVFAFIWLSSQSTCHFVCFAPVYRFSEAKRNQLFTPRCTFSGNSATHRGIQYRRTFTSSGVFSLQMFWCFFSHLFCTCFFSLNSIEFRIQLNFFHTVHAIICDFMLWNRNSSNIRNVLHTHALKANAIV